MCNGVTVTVETSSSSAYQSWGPYDPTDPPAVTDVVWMHLNTATNVQWLWNPETLSWE